MKQNNLMSIVVIAMSLAISCLGGCTCSLKSQLASASTSEQEVKVFNDIFVWAKPSGIAFFDRQENHIRFDELENSKLDSIVISWPDGVTAKHKMIDSNNIGILLGPSE